MGEVDFTISGEANGCTIDNGILIWYNGTVKLLFQFLQKDVNGDNINEYNAFTGIDAITVTINDKATQAPLSITNCDDGDLRTDAFTLRAEGGQRRRCCHIYRIQWNRRGNDRVTFLKL